MLQKRGLQREGKTPALCPAREVSGPFGRLRTRERLRPSLARAGRGLDAGLRCAEWRESRTGSGAQRLPPVSRVRCKMGCGSAGGERGPRPAAGEALGPLPRRAPPTPGCGLILLVSTTFARLEGCDSAHGSQVIIQSIHDAFLRSALGLLELLLIQYGANQDPVCIPRCRNKGPRPGAGAQTAETCSSKAWAAPVLPDLSP